jgi:hypothetical protein
LNRNILSKISPDPSFSKRGIPPFRKGRGEGFGFLDDWKIGI